MSRFWSPAQRIAIRCDAAQTPQRITWDERQHEVAEIVARWRVDTRWWRGRVWREYLVLTTRSGLLIEIYHDLRADRWYLQRLVD